VCDHWSDKIDFGKNNMNPRAIASIVGLLGSAFSFKHGFAGSKSISNISRGEHVVFFTTHSWYDRHLKTWNIPIHGWVYGLESRPIVRAMFSELLERKYGLKKSADTENNFSYRTQLLTADNEGGKRIVINLLGRRYPLPKSEPNGHFKSVIAIAESELDEYFAKTSDSRKEELAFSLVLRPNDTREYIGKSLLIQSSGVSIISDIDDTVKLSYVTDHKKLFESSFYKDFMPIKGMPELYRGWLQQGAKFHYVSSSPWQLYEPLQEFMQEHDFPQATFSLKMIRLKDQTFFNLFKSATKTKPQAIEAILKHYPDRKFVLLGDSGEKDAQVYAQIANDHPEKIAKIYIRNVNGDQGLDELYCDVFDGLPRILWQIFENPSEIETNLPRA
jgi:hypothetical protein